MWQVKRQRSLTPKLGAGAKGAVDASKPQVATAPRTAIAETAAGEQVWRAQAHVHMNTHIKACTRVRARAQGETAVAAAAAAGDPVSADTAIQVGDRLRLLSSGQGWAANTVVRVVDLSSERGKPHFTLEIPPKKPPQTDDDDPGHVSVTIDHLVEYKAIRIASEGKGAMEAAPAAAAQAPAAAALAVTAGVVPHLATGPMSLNGVVYNACRVRLPPVVPPHFHHGFPCLPLDVARI